MKLGKEGKLKVAGDPDKIWLLEALIDCATQNKDQKHYQGIYYDQKVNFWFSTDGFRLFAVSGTLLPERETSGKFIPKNFAEDLSCTDMPETSRWFFDVTQLIPKEKPKVKMTLLIPAIIGAADDKKYAGHMTINFEKGGYFTYLGKLPEEKLAEDFIHFNMCNWSHLGGKEVILNYYGPKASTLILPANGTNKVALDNKWFSIIMPTRDPGSEIIIKAETE